MTHEPFSNPLPEPALDAFCHPSPTSLFSRPARGDRELLAANGYMAIRAHRGAWLENEHPPASEKFLQRFNRLPWGTFETLNPDDWRDLAVVQPHMRKHGPLAVWRDTAPQLHPSPVWRVGDVLVRLSMLQLLARLPRCEVAWTHRGGPLWFRCTGARGCIAQDRGLLDRNLSSFDIFQPSFDRLSRTLRKNPAPKPRGNLAPPPPPEPPLDDWPPAEPD